MKTLLLQARHADDPAIDHEQACFAEKSGLSREQIVAHDLLTGVPSAEAVFRNDALFIGGSGAFDVSRGNLPHFDAVLALLRQVVDAGHPMFGSCFGYHLTVQALGGEVVRDKEQSEVGSFEVALTQDGRDDPLFGTLPDRFVAQMGHKDRPTRQPAGVLNLASSPRSPLQALRVPGKPIWAAQFHPELDDVGNMQRIELYADSYTATFGDNTIERMRERSRPSPEASALLRHFVGLVASRSATA